MTIPYFELLCALFAIFTFLSLIIIMLMILGSKRGE